MPSLADYRDVVRRLRRQIVHFGCDFVARVHSPWTQLGLEVWITQELSRDASGHVLLMPVSSGRPMPLDPGLKELLRDYRNIHVSLVAPFLESDHRRLMRDRFLHGSLRLLHPGSGRRTRIVAGRDPDLAVAMDLGLRLANIRFEVIDEGFGGAPAVGWDGLGFRSRKLLRQTLIRPAAVRTHFLIDPAQRAVNEKLRSAYQARLSAGPTVPLPLGDRPVALLATSYLSELGRTTLAEEVSGCGAAIRRLNDAGYQVLLKPHPRSKPDKFDHVLTADTVRLDGALRGEACLTALRKTDIVVGPISNLLFTAQVLFGLQIYVLPGADYGTASTRVGERAYAPYFPDGLPGIESLGALETAEAAHTTSVSVG